MQSHVLLSGHINIIENIDRPRNNGDKVRQN